MVYNEQMVAYRIAEMRRQKCLSQEELAARMHVSVTTLWRFESGRQQIMLERAVKMANILGCTVNDMVRDFLEYPVSNNTDRFTALLQTCDDAEQDFLYEAMGALLNVTPGGGFLLPRFKNNVHGLRCGHHCKG